MVAVQAFYGRLTGDWMRGFQSPSRDGGRSGLYGNGEEGSIGMFQSPSRDGGRSGIYTIPVDTGWPAVSIPQSGWWPFRLAGAWPLAAIGAGFNPPVGMVAVQAMPRASGSGASRAFQSPSRDGGRSGLRLAVAKSNLSVVSIPQSGWWPFRLHSAIPIEHAALFQSPSRDGGRSGILPIPVSSRWGKVSIPQSGWWPFRPGPV